MNKCTVKLVAITKPLIEGINTTEEFISYTARVSNPNNQLNTETSDKLLRYLVKNQHWSPFEMAHAVMEVNTTRDIARQILRHRSFSFQEFSQRYARADDLGFVLSEARMQDTKNRQASNETQDEYLRNEWARRQSEILDLVIKEYTWALDSGIAKEQARKVLPEGLTRSRLYMSGSIRSWLHYVAIRKEDGTQKEHRQVAVQAIHILQQELPAISQLIDDLKSN